VVSKARLLSKITKCAFKSIDELIDGKDFYELEMWMVESLIKSLKMIKKFRDLWTEETGMVSQCIGSIR